MWPVIWPPSSTCRRRQRAVPSTLPVARTTSEPRAVSVPSIVPAISASSTSTSPLKMPPGEIASSVAWIMLASTVPSTTRRSASCTVPCTLIPRPTTRVRRSPGSRAGERTGGKPGRAPLAGGGAQDGGGGERTGGKPGRAPLAGGAAKPVGAGESGGRDMGCASFGGAGRNGGTPRPVSPDPDGEPNGEAECTTVWVAPESVVFEAALTPAGNVAPEPIGTSSG